MGYAGHMDGIRRSYGWDTLVIWMGYAGHMDGICRSYGWDTQVMWMGYAGHMDGIRKFCHHFVYKTVCLVCEVGENKGSSIFISRNKRKTL